MKENAWKKVAVNVFERSKDVVEHFTVTNNHNTNLDTKNHHIHHQLSLRKEHVKQRAEKSN